MSIIEILTIYFHWNMIVLGVLYGLIFVIALCFDRDYGRASCWQRDVFDFSSFAAAVPFLCVGLILYGCIGLPFSIMRERMRGAGSRVK